MMPAATSAIKSSDDWTQFSEAVANEKSTDCYMKYSYYV